MTSNRNRLLALGAYLAIVTLVVGGLAWVTREALALKHSEIVRLALWRLDSRVFSALVREDNRPAAHFDPLYPPIPAVNVNGVSVPPGTVLVPSPLLSAELPPWMALHFSVDSRFGWRSPQVIDAGLTERLARVAPKFDTTNVNPQRDKLLVTLSAQFPTKMLLHSEGNEQTDVANAPPAQQAMQTQQRAQPSDFQTMQTSDRQDFVRRGTQQSAVRNEGKGAEWANNSILNILPPGGKYFAEKESGGNSAMVCTNVRVDPLAPKWVADRSGEERLFLLRAVRTNELNAVQGVYLDWDKLKDVLLEEIHDLLPDAKLEIAEHDSGDRMSALPVRLVAQPPSLFSLNSPLRIGLVLAWAAAALALSVVGFGGWTLLDLSERRFRFVTSVTHELRTPLTTLRLYLDMLTSGLIRDPAKREEYLGTLHAESERLHRLVGNVLDFARLERQRPKVERRTVDIAQLLEGLKNDWDSRCTATGKHLLIEIASGVPRTILTDPELLRQILGNLIDNACKYSRDAADPHLWLRAFSEETVTVFEVEDRGPGVSRRDGRSVFRPFARGNSAHEIAGGVGLGLALAARWAKLLRGRLILKSIDSPGACFRLQLP